MEHKIEAPPSPDGRANRGHQSMFYVLNIQTTEEILPEFGGIKHPRIHFVYTSSKIRCKSTDFGVPPAEPDHGLNLCDHNCGHLMQWKCDVPTAAGTIVHTAVPVHVPRYL
jgi:hypothetical protein